MQAAIHERRTHGKGLNMTALPAGLVASLFLFIVLISNLGSLVAAHGREETAHRNDPYSSNTRLWDDFTRRATCGPAAKGACCAQNLQGCPGCNDTRVEECVCKEDARCCADTWDSICVSRATKSCGADCPTKCTNPCNQVSTCPGCADKTQRDCVCGRIPECCSMAWSARCVSMVISACGGVAPSPSSTPSASPSYVPPSPTPSISVSPSASPSFVPPSPTPSASATASVSPSTSLSPSVSPTAAASGTGPTALGVAVFLSVIGCLLFSTGAVVAFYFYRKRRRTVEHLGVDATNPGSYTHLDEDDEDDLFEGAVDDEEDMPDPFAEEFVSREMEMGPITTKHEPHHHQQPSRDQTHLLDQEHGNGRDVEAAAAPVAGDNSFGRDHDNGHGELVLGVGHPIVDDAASGEDDEDPGLDMFAEQQQQQQSAHDP